MATPSIPSASSLSISAAAIRQLDLTPLEGLATLPLGALLERSDSLSLAFEWPRSPEDPRELSEIAEVRLWSLRADALHPWLPLLLERSGGQLTRHVAMLLPHGFSRSEGIRFAAESLELWITHRLFLLDHLARLEGLSCRGSLGQMAAVLGFELDAGFWQALPAP
ncbi:MAG: CRR6 family NdhI maturation factor [Synechococcaceae cyanobacterium ELA739]